MNDVNPGDVLEFFDGEGFVSGTFKEREPGGEREMLRLRVGNEDQLVHPTDVMAVLRRKEE